MYDAYHANQREKYGLDPVEVFLIHQDFRHPGPLWTVLVDDTTIFTGEEYLATGIAHQLAHFHETKVRRFDWPTDLRVEHKVAEIQEDEYNEAYGAYDREKGWKDHDWGFKRREARKKHDQAVQ